MGGKSLARCFATVVVSTLCNTLQPLRNRYKYKYLLAFYFMIWLHQLLLTTVFATNDNPINNRCNPMKFSLGQAARETGLDKSTLSRAIKSGRLSAQRKNGNSGYEIDSAELFRVFPPVPNAQASSPPVDAPADVLLENRELRIKLEAAQARIRDKDEEVHDLRRRLDLEGEERRKLTMMLLAHRPLELSSENTPGQTVDAQQQPAPQPPATATPPPKKTGVWAWLMGAR